VSDTENGTATITVTPKAGLATGTYTTSITITGEYGKVDPLTIPVTLIVSENGPALPDYELSCREAFSFGEYTKNVTSPDPIDLQLRSVGTAECESVTMALKGDIDRFKFFLDGDELDTANVGGDHTVYSVITAATDTDNLYINAADSIFFKLETHLCILLI
jgi:hypothetical protein